MQLDARFWPTWAQRTNIIRLSGRNTQYPVLSVNKLVYIICCKTYNWTNMCQTNRKVSVALKEYKQFIKDKQTTCQQIVNIEHYYTRNEDDGWAVLERCCEIVNLGNSDQEKLHSKTICFDRLTIGMYHMCSKGPINRPPEHNQKLYSASHWTIKNHVYICLFQCLFQFKR